MSRESWTKEKEAGGEREASMQDRTWVIPRVWRREVLETTSWPAGRRGGVGGVLRGRRRKRRRGGKRKEEFGERERQRRKKRKETEKENVEQSRGGK